MTAPSTSKDTKMMEVFKETFSYAIVDGVYQKKFDVSDVGTFLASDALYKYVLKENIFDTLGKKIDSGSWETQESWALRILGVAGTYYLVKKYGMRSSTNFMVDTVEIAIALLGNDYILSKVVDSSTTR